MLFTKTVKKLTIAFLVIFSMLFFGLGVGNIFSNTGEKKVLADTLSAKAVYNDVNNSLTFYYDAESHTGEYLTVYDLPTYAMNDYDWGYNSQRGNIKKVVIDESMKDYGGFYYIRYMFANITNVTEIIGLDNLNVNNVTLFSGMFEGCTNLTTLDLTSFNTSKATNMGYMFRNCTSLTAIYVSENFKKASSYSENMFTGCINLKGDKGTEYDSSHTNEAYARLDGGESAKGYFSEKVVLTAKSVYVESEKSLTFYYDAINHEASATQVYSVAENATCKSDWGYDSVRSSIQKVVFDESFSKYHNITSTAYMFADFTGLEDIISIDNLDTNGVVNMQATFKGCKNLTALDVTDFDTSNVTDMSQMLQGLEKITVLNLTTFATYKVTDMSQMFNGCAMLSEIYVSSAFVTTSVINSEDMFTGCVSIVGGSGTTYDPEKADKEYAVIDSDKGKGYFTTGGSPKIIYDGNEKTLYFYCNDSEYDTLEENVYKYEMPKTAKAEDDWGYHEHRSQIEKVVFDSSFIRFRGLMSMKNMFNGCLNVTEIQGLQYLDTSSVTDMSWAFYNCISLTRLDLSSLDTEEVTKMESMFEFCYTLQALDISNFNTAKVTKMEKMFHGCQNLIDIDVSSFDTSKVGSMRYMFAECEVIQSIDLTNFNTSSLTDMEAMFKHCVELKTVDLSSFDTSNVTSMEDLFRYNNKLETVLASKKFVVDNVTIDAGMFAGCIKIVGGNGTKYDGNYNGKTYAKIDGGESDKGYFTNGVKFAKAVYDETSDTLTFKYDINAYGANSFDLPINASSATDWGYEGIAQDIKSVIFDASFGAYKELKSIAYMFYGFTEVNTISGTEYLVTENVTDMSCAFSMCLRLKEIDLTHFNTEKVTNMSDMFFGCSRIEQFDLTSFDTACVMNMSNMFIGCENLKTITVSDKFNVGGVTNGDDMFYGCVNLVGENFTEYTPLHTGLSYAKIDGDDGDGYFTSINPKKAVLVFDEQAKTVTYYYGREDHSGTGLRVYEYLCRESITDGEYYDDGTLEAVETVVIDSSFRIYNGVKKMDYMFASFDSVTSFMGLENINTSLATSMGSLFYGCESLETLDLTSFDTKNVIDMRYMFGNCSSLKSLNILSFDVSSVTDMLFMFSGCKSLPVIDISSFDTTGNSQSTAGQIDDTPAITVNMQFMFSGCQSLHTILVSENFKVSGINMMINPSDNIFSGCVSLVGGKGTRFDDSADQSARARIDGEGGPGYFTLKVVMNIDVSSIALKNSTLYYIGETVFPEITGIDQDYYSLTGDVSANSTGNFSVTLCLKKGYYFSDKLTNTTSIEYKVQSAPVDTVTIDYANLAYEDSVYIMFAVKVRYVTSIPKLYVWGIGDGEYLTEDEDCTEILPEEEMEIIGGEEYYAFIYTKVGAKQMSDNFYVIAKVGTCSSAVLKYSVIQYVSNTYEKQDQDFKDLLTAMLDYGTAAQKAFKVWGESGEKVPYNAKRLANGKFYKISLGEGLILSDGTDSGLFAEGEIVKISTVDGVPCDFYVGETLLESSAVTFSYTVDASNAHIERKE